MDLEFNSESVKTEIPRGIPPSLLIDQVYNTAPFIWTEPELLSTMGQKGSNRRYIDLLRAKPVPKNHTEYFELCLAAHHGSVATFVPTDVDNQIRFKLWDPRLPSAEIEQMADGVVESLSWDSTVMSDRWLRSPQTGEILSGHQGEWFSTAAAAYGAFRKRSPDRAAWIAELILREMLRETQILEDLLKAGDGVGVLKAATLLAHNLGDLDRVLDQWNLPEEDAFKQSVFKAGHEKKTLFPLTLMKAGELNKVYMAEENHRHFALRKVKALRRHRDFLLPLGPFLDDWGYKIARHPGLTPEELAEVVEALMDGWMRLKGKAVGYPRALSGIEQGVSGGLSRLCQYLPAKSARMLRSGELRALSSIPQHRFEMQWSQNALKFMFQ